MIANQPLLAIFQGYGIAIGLIAAIGAQNAFVLRQGLRRNHPFIIAAICSANDALLIVLGVVGFGVLVERAPFMLDVARWGGAAFVTYYGVMSLRSAFRSQAMKINGDGENPGTLRAVVLATLAFTLLNPHVYLDTVVLIGGVGANYAPELRPFFAFGASMASVSWFFALAYGASLLAPLFRRPITWRILDAGVALIMFTIALSLVREGMGW